MNSFTIRDIENLCGIKAHTLRIWEQRYNLCVARRKESRHRVYDNDDLKELLRISFLYHNGHKISKLAALSSGEVKELVGNFSVKDDNHESFVHQLIAAGIDFDKEKFEKTVNCLVVRIGLEKAMINVFYPFLQRIGLLWMTNNVIPAQEHFVSHIIRKKIILATDGLETGSGGTSTILVFAPRGEFHEIPLLAVNYFFRKYGNRTVYFGDNVPAGCLKEYLQQHPVTHIYTHVTTNLNNEWLDEYICSLCRDFPGKEVIVSGPACKCIENAPPNLRVIHSLDEMIAFAKENGAAILASHNS
ncbi:MAG TPA: MerR family transcriptional regulator [Chitinophagaceae bacterium]|jgi:DNA-binding transcriptional MerR regulator|nr:MerR family transcriptional regulator [Chitinophagaceae bacterium]